MHKGDVAIRLIQAIGNSPNRATAESDLRRIRDLAVCWLSVFEAKTVINELESGFGIERADDQEVAK